MTAENDLIRESLENGKIMKTRLRKGFDSRKSGKIAVMQGTASTLFLDAI